MADKETTVEIEEPVAAPAIEPKIEAKPTREDLKKQGWSAPELERAEKRGMIGEAKKEEPKKEEPKKEEPKPVEKPKAAGGIPEMGELTPEKEAAFVAAFGPGTPQHGLYFRMKAERRQRQASEARTRELEARIQAIEKIKTQPDPEPEDDPEEKPLTLKLLKQMRDEEAKQLQARKAEIDERTHSVVAAQKEQEEFAKSVYPDFDEVTDRAKDVIKNIDTLIAEPWKKAKVIHLMRQLQVAAASADKLGLDEYHGAMIAYEIGQLHPEHGKAKEPEAPATDTKKLSPEQIARATKNAERRPSSAAVNGNGGKRIISIEDVDLKTLNGMTAKQRWDFRQKHPDHYAKIVNV